MVESGFVQAAWSDLPRGIDSQRRIREQTEGIVATEEFLVAHVVAIVARHRDSEFTLQGAVQ